VDDVEDEWLVCVPLSPLPGAQGTYLPGQTEVSDSRLEKSGSDFDLVFMRNLALIVHDLPKLLARVFEYVSSSAVSCPQWLVTALTRL